MKNSTYSLLVRSEEKGRTVLETAMYSLVALSVAFSIYQAANQPVQIPGDAAPAPQVVQTADTVVQRG